jgi:hypothetical protein
VRGFLSGVVKKKLKLRSSRARTAVTGPIASRVARRHDPASTPRRHL